MLTVEPKPLIVKLHGTEVNILSTYHHAYGVGLKMEGYPTSLIRFYKILASQSCHPKATRRILQRIKQNGFDQLTVRNRLEFAKIGKQLSQIGVTITFIPPLEDWEERHNDGAWPNWAIPK